MYSHLKDIDRNSSLTLDDLSKIKASELIPSIVYLCILMIVGVAGNACVLIIYYFRFGPSVHRCFILVLAFYDFFACAVGAPWTITESFFAYNYTDEISCKIFRFILYYSCIASSLTLVLIAFERSRKICTPLKEQLTVPGAKKALFVVAGVISAVSAAPAFVFYGNSTVHTGVGDRNGTRCFVTDFYEHKHTEGPLAFNVYLLLLAFASTLCMAFCYARIARQVSKMGKANVARRIQAARKSNCEMSSVGTDDELTAPDVPEFRSKECSSDNISVSSNGLPKLKKMQSVDGISINSSDSTRKNRTTFKQRTSKWANRIKKSVSSSSGKKTLRVTKMLTMVTVAFVMSYLPHLTLQIWDIFVHVEHKSSLPADNIYKLLFYSFLVNNLVNPFIYASMDLKFRRELKKLIKCDFTWKKVV